MKTLRLLTVTTKIFKTLTILIQSSSKTFLPFPMSKYEYGSLWRSLYGRFYAASNSNISVRHKCDT